MKFPNGYIIEYSNLTNQSVSSSSIIGPASSPARVFNAEDISDLASETGINSEDLSSIRNFLSSRLFSGNVYLNSAMAARSFDRTFAKLIDPDEFLIPNGGDSQGPGDHLKDHQEATLNNLSSSAAAASGDKFGLGVEPLKDPQGNITHYRVISKSSNEDSQSLNQFFVYIRPTMAFDNRINETALMAIDGASAANFSMIGSLT